MAKKLPYYPMYVDDFDDDKNVIEMSLTEVGLYQLTLNRCWKLGSVPDDPAAIAILIRRKLSDVKKAWPKVRACFVPNGDPGRLVNPRQELEREKALGKSGKATNAALTRHHGKGSSSAEKMRSHDLSTNLAVLRAYDSDSDSKDSKKVNDALRFDFAESFDAIWNAYPAKGRTHQIDSERQFMETMAPLQIEQQIALQAEILAAITGKWAVSDVWHKGFVMKLSEWLRNRRWSESPEPSKEVSGKSMVEDLWEVVNANRTT